MIYFLVITQHMGKCGPTVRLLVFGANSLGDGMVALREIAPIKVTLSSVIKHSPLHVITLLIQFIYLRHYIRAKPHLLIN